MLTKSLTLFFVPLLSLCSGICIDAGVPEKFEDKAKARTVTILLDNTRWPDSSDMPKRKILMNIFGNLSFKDSLEQLFQSKSHFLERTTFYAENLSKLANCDALFICDSEFAHLEEILAQTKGKPVLTLTDVPGSAQRGIMVTVLMNKGRLKLEVNLREVRASGLELEPSILKIAEVFE